MVLSSLLPALVLALLAVGVGADSSYTGTDRGLRPQILKAYNRIHYYQLVFFHGCARSARNFFPYHPELCSTCLGLPEHVSHTKQALAHGYNVLAMEPNDDKVLCWSSSDRGQYTNDQPDVIDTVNRFLVMHHLTDKPVYLWGASSGGTLALKLPSALALAAKQAQEGEYVFKVAGIISEVATPTDFAHDSRGNLGIPDYPPTVFVRMQRDGSDEDAMTNVNFLRNNNVPAAMWTSPVRQIGPNFFSDRSASITPYQSQLIVQGLRQIGMLDVRGWLMADPHNYDDPRDPRAFGWTRQLEKLLPWLQPTSKTVSLVLRFSPIQQELNVAFARHDTVSDFFTACLKWLEARGRASLPALVAQYRVPNSRLSALMPYRIGPVVPNMAREEPEEPATRQPEDPEMDDGGSSDEMELTWENEEPVGAISSMPQRKPEQSKPEKSSWSITW